MHTASPATSFSEVRFQLADEAFSLAFDDVLGRVEQPSVRRVPGAHPWFDGVIAWQGRFLPALNGRRRLGLPEAPADLTLVALVVRWHEEAFALLVDPEPAAEQGEPPQGAACTPLSAAALLGEEPLACPFVSSDSIED